MIKATFLVDVEVATLDEFTLLDTAEAIYSELEGAIPVLEVRPWDRHGTQQIQQNAGLGAIPGLPESSSVPPLGGSLL